MATKAVLVRMTVRNLRVLAAGAIPPAEDSALVGDALDEVHAELTGKGLTNDGAGVWTVEAVPPELIQPYVVLASSTMADTFHVPDDRIVRLRLEAIEAENRIRRQIAVLNDGEPVKAEQF